MGGNMPLTPEDVSNKRFTPVRLREGYDMGEVDQFLDEVEAELARLTRENDDLRTKLAAAQTGGGSSMPDNTAQTPAVQERVPEPEPEPEPAAAPAPPAPEPVVAAAAAAPQTIRVETVPEASNAAARLLEIATRNADELVEMAKDEADKIIGEARTKPGGLEPGARARAARLEPAAPPRPQMLAPETAERRQQMCGERGRGREKLNSGVETPRAFERESRSRLKSYFG